MNQPQGTQKSNSRLERDGRLWRLEGDEGLERDDACPDRLLERPEGPGRLERLLGVLSASENTKRPKAKCEEKPWKSLVPKRI